MAKVKKVMVFSPKYVAAVEEGVKFLDLVVGRKRWLKNMDLSDFEIQRPSTCVAGNIFKDAMFDGQDDGYNSFLGAVTALGGNEDKTSERFGFVAQSDKGFQQLQDLWVRKITLLKKQAAK